MPKSHNNLFNKLLSYEVLEKAFYIAARGKSHKSVVSDFRNNLPVELLQLLQELQSGTYRPRPYRTFQVYEPKKRTIQAPHFRDVVVQRAINDLIEPIFERTFIHDSYGCRTGKGTHRASDVVQNMMRGSDRNNYYLQMDISKYFYSIDRQLLLDTIRKKITDHKLMALLELFLPDPVGIPIGNLLSQLFQNIFMNSIDQYCKRELGVVKYVRYVDDFVIIDESRQRIHTLLMQIEQRLKQLHLTLSRFTIQTIKRGINFCGYRTWSRTKFLRRKQINKFKSNLKLLSRSNRNEEINRSLQSCLGHSRPTANYTSFYREYQQLCQKSTSTHQL